MPDMDLEEEGQAEAALLEMTMLQTKLRTHRGALTEEGREAAVAVVARAAGKEHAVHSDSAAGTAADRTASAATAAADTAAADGSEVVVSLDHNGNICMLCGKPLPERVGERKYEHFRGDCGGRSSPTGPSVEDLSAPAAGFLQPGGAEKAATNGFCELNFAKSCVDAVANEDYLYWSKSLDLAHPSMKANVAWDARYCQLNGFLETGIVALQHNFTGMRSEAAELCSSKYAKYGIQQLTFLDMMAKSRYDERSTPTLEEAEFLAAWNCAMGDLGCDMAMCAYSFCDKGEGSVGLYGDCKGWHPVHGMPMQEAMAA